MNEGIGGFDCFPDAVDIGKKANNNGKLKPAGCLTRKRKNGFGKLRKNSKCEKKKEANVTSVRANCAIVEEEEGEDEDSSDVPVVLSSTSAAESVTLAKAKLTELKFKKAGNSKSCFNFANIVESLNAAPFVFGKRLSRIDWRKLHTIDVDRVVREVDLDTLESVLDTITFGDIQGEDTRNFTEANFIKVFRLAQLLVEYLLHVQELLATHKEKLLETGAQMQRRAEKHRQKQAKLLSDLSVLRHELKQAKKVVRTYEVMLRVQSKSQNQQQKLQESQQDQKLQLQQQSKVGAQTVRCCPLCDKMFESTYYLDLHFSRRHPKVEDNPEDKILAAVTKAEEATAARVRAETTAALQAEIKLVQAMSQAEAQRVQALGQLQISSLEAAVRESNAKLQEVQSQLQAQTFRKDVIPPEKEKKETKMQQRLKEMDERLQSFHSEMKHLNEDNSRLVKELTSAHFEVSHMKEMQEKLITQGRDQGPQDLQANNGKWKLERCSTSDRRVGKERGKWKHGHSSEPEKSESEGRQSRHKQMSDNQLSSPERKRKQRSQHDTFKTAHSPKKIERYWSTTGQPRESSPARHRKYKSHEERKKSPETHAPHPPSGSPTPTSESCSPKSQSGRQTSPLEDMHDPETGMQRPQLEVRFKDVGERALVLAKAEIEQDLVRAGEIRLSKEDGGKVASKIANFETKFGSKKIRREEAEIVRRSAEEMAGSREKKERREAKEKVSIEEAMEEEARRKAEIADAATMDVGEDQPSIPPSEKEKWLEEHPCIPFPQRPHVLSKYPHTPNAFSSTRDEVAHQLGEQLHGELKKFGFGRETAGISDSVYDAAKAALEKQHKMRVSNLQPNQKKTLEYERGALLWQTQRAVRERDIQIIESHFDVESDDSSQHSPSVGSCSPSGEVTDDSSTSQRGKSAGLGRGARILRSPQASMSPSVRSPRSPRSPMSSGLKVHKQVKQEMSHISEILDTSVSVSGYKQIWGGGRKHVTNTIADLHSPPQSLKRFTARKESPPSSCYDTHHGKDSMSTPINPTIAKFKKVEANSRFEVEDENQGEAFGLGQWDSDEDVPPTTTLRGRRKQPPKDLPKSPKSGQDQHDLDSNNGSEESKIFQELDAEIDEIIRL